MYFFKGADLFAQSREEEEGGLENEKINQTQNLESNINDVKSLSELKTENKKLEVDLNKSRDQILKLKNQIKDLTQKLQDIEKLLEDGDIPLDKKDVISQILQGRCNDFETFHNLQFNIHLMSAREGNSFVFPRDSMKRNKNQKNIHTTIVFCDKNNTK